MEVLKEFFSNELVQRTCWSLVIVIFSLVVYGISSKFLSAKEKKNSKIFSSKKNKTYLRMIRNILRAALTILTVLTVLQIFGVNVSSMLAGVGIVSIVVGFALQDALKDIIRGLEIISDSYYEIGDVIIYGDITGEVLSIGLRTTRLRDINTMNIVSIANRNIDQVSVVSPNLYLTIPLPYEVKPTTVDAVFEDIVKHLRAHAKVTGADYLGLSSIDDSSIGYMVAVSCDPIDKLIVRRLTFRTAVDILAAHHISIPYNQLDIHDKK